MFLILLRFSANRSEARRHMEDHNAWLQRGFDAGVFLMSGSLAAGAGGAIVAQHDAPEDLRRRVDEDPFVVHDVVNAEIVEFTPNRCDERLAFLKP